MSRVKGSFGEALAAAEEGGKKSGSNKGKKSVQTGQKGTRKGSSEEPDPTPGTSAAAASATNVGEKSKKTKKKIRKPKYFKSNIGDDDDPSGEIGDKTSKRVYDRFILFWVDCDMRKKNFNPVFEASNFLNIS